MIRDPDAIRQRWPGYTAEETEMRVQSEYLYEMAKRMNVIARCLDTSATEMDDETNE